MWGVYSLLWDTVHPDWRDSSVLSLISDGLFRRNLKKLKFKCIECTIKALHKIIVEMLDETHVIIEVLFSG